MFIFRYSWHDGPKNNIIPWSVGGQSELIIDQSNRFVSKNMCCEYFIELIHYIWKFICVDAERVYKLWGIPQFLP